MKFDDLFTDEALLLEMGQRIAATRIGRNETQEELAEAAGVSPSTVERIERGKGNPGMLQYLRILRALGLVGRLEALLPEVIISPMEVVQNQGRQRQRASGRRVQKESSVAGKQWKWGEK